MRRWRSNGTRTDLRWRKVLSLGLVGLLLNVPSRRLLYPVYGINFSSVRIRAGHMFITIEVAPFMNTLSNTVD